MRSVRSVGGRAAAPPPVLAVKWQLLLYAGTGAAEWLLLEALPGRYNANYSGNYYLLALFVGTFVFGVVDPRSPHIRAGLFTVAPALLLALWTTPRGDNDGLWMLVIPLLFFVAFLVALCHWLGAGVRRVLDR